MILLLEILENQKKNYCVFFLLIFLGFNRKIKKNNAFLGFFNKNRKKHQKTYCVFLDFRVFLKPKTSKIQKQQ